MGWTGTARFTIRAADQTAAATIAEQVEKEIDALVRTEHLLELAPEGDELDWTLVVEYDFSELPTTPDNAATRIKYLIRNLGGATWQVHGEDSDQSRYTWPAQAHPGREHREILVHPAVRAAAIEVSRGVQ